MRAGLPNAQYLAFTGTPLLGRRRKTNEWFGDYVSEYNFSQSMDDGATLPLFYKKRVPEVLNQNDDLSEEFYEILEGENLEDAQQAKLEKQFANELEIIKRDDRLETIARANRVCSHKINGVEKKNGEVIDYYGVFGRLKKAIKDYGQGDEADEPPVRDKDELLRLLDKAIEQGNAFCESKTIRIGQALESDDIFQKVGLFEDWANKLLEKDEWRKSFGVYENAITGLFEASKPEILGKPVVRTVAAFQYLRAFLEKKLAQMLSQNRTRRDFAQRLQDVIDEHNAGTTSADALFDELMAFTQDLKDEDERHIREGLTEDELEIYDLLRKDKMTKDEKKTVRLAAKALLKRLTDEQPRVLVQDWFKDSQTRLAVRDEVGKVLDLHLSEEGYDKTLFTQKRDKVFELTLDLAINHQKWAA